MTGDPDSGIIRQHTIEALRHFVCSISDDDLAGVQGIANTNSAAVVEGNPACTRRGIEQGIQYGPIGESR